MRLLSLPQCLSHASITWCRAPWQQFPENGDNYTWRWWVTKMPSSPLTRTCSRKRGIWAIRPLFAHSVINRMRSRVVNAWWLVSKTWHAWSGSPRCGTSTISSAKNFLVFAPERLVVKIGAEIEVLGCPGPGWCSWRWRSRYDDDSGIPVTRELTITFNLKLIKSRSSYDDTKMSIPDITSKRIKTIICKIDVIINMSKEIQFSQWNGYYINKPNIDVYLNNLYVTMRILPTCNISYYGIDNSSLIKYKLYIIGTQLLSKHTESLPEPNLFLYKEPFI